MPSVFIATYRATFAADSDVEAAVIAERIRENAELDLDTTEDGDEVIQTQLTESTIAVLPQEVIIRLTQVRNDLIKMKVKDCWELAESANRLIHALKRSLAVEDASVSYDHSSFMKTVELVLRGVNPQ